MDAGIAAECLMARPGACDLFAVSAAALILACVAGWAISDTARPALPTGLKRSLLALRMTGRHPELFASAELITSQARVAAPATVQIDPLTMSAKQMPPEHFADYSFVFN